MKGRAAVTGSFALQRQPDPYSVAVWVMTHTCRTWPRTGVLLPESEPIVVAVGDGILGKCGGFACTERRVALLTHLKSTLRRHRAFVGIIVYVVPALGYDGIGLQLESTERGARPSVTARAQLVHNAAATSSSQSPRTIAPAVTQTVLVRKGPLFGANGRQTTQ
eukprot:COSAG01_NODE_4911_length_4633_cov_19.139171_3_plen_164_part_00